MMGYKGWRILEGNVVQVAYDSGVVLWKLESDKPIILEVEKITSDTYAGETTYTGEQFILLDVYPKTNGTVNITYGSLTKTITDTSGAEEPNAQQVFFGTFNGVTDEVATPASGTLTIEGDCRGFTCSHYASSSKSSSVFCPCITAINNFGNLALIMDYSFSGGIIGRHCDKISSVTIPSTIKTIGMSAFQGCTGLTNVTISNGVATIDMSAFQDCTGLTNVTIPSSVTTIDVSAFQGCTGLTNVTIPSSVTTIDMSAFEECTGLTNVIISNGVTTIKVSVFEDCTGLTNVTIPSSVTTIVGNPFAGCTALADIVVIGNNFAAENGILFNADKTIFIAYPTASGGYSIPSSVTTIDMSAFHGCTGLTNITIPSSVTTIGVHAFLDCTGLTNVTIPSSVTTIGVSAFQGCTGLTNVTFNDISGWYVSESIDLSNPISVDVSDPTNNVILTTDTYVDYYWFRSE